jgi:hypothetical protein
MVIPPHLMLCFPNHRGTERSLCLNKDFETKRAKANARGIVAYTFISSIQFKVQRARSMATVPI